MAGLDKMFGSGDDPSTISNVKNPAIAARVNGALVGYDQASKRGQSGLADYISSYFAGEPAAQRRGTQEVSNLDRYFDGGAERELAGLRLSRSNAVSDAANRAADYALANVSRSRAAGEGGPSSYDRRLLQRGVGDILTQAAVDNAVQERGDWDLLEGRRLGLTGERNRLADTLAARSLMPAAMSRRETGADLDLLGKILNLEQANTFYGLENNPGIGESFVGDYGSAMDAY